MPSYGWPLLVWGIIPKKLGLCSVRRERDLSNAPTGFVLSLGIPVRQVPGTGTRLVHGLDPLAQVVAPPRFDPYADILIYMHRFSWHPTGRC